MSKILTILALALFLGLSLGEAEVEDGVIVLTDANFQEELAKYPFLLVEFYAPWCGHCKKLAPEYSAAAKELRERDPPLYLAKVDATTNKEQAGKHAVRGYPTLFFYKNGQKQQYNGARNKQGIIDWVTKRSGPPSTAVTCDELKEKVKKDKLALVLMGEAVDSAKHFKIFEDAANNARFVELYQFYHVSDKDCAAEHKVENVDKSLVIFRNFDESPIIFNDEFRLPVILSWIELSSIPQVIFYDTKAKADYERGRRPIVILFREEKDSGSEWEKAFIQAASELKGEMTFAVSDVTEKAQKELASQLGANKDELPALFIHKIQGGQKFKADVDPREIKDTEAIRKVIADFKDNKIPVFIKSEPIPDNTDTPLKVVVSKTFDQIIMDPTKDVLVKFYAPWCGHCKKLAPTWEKLAEDLKDVPDLVIAKFDATANDVQGLAVKGYPTLNFYGMDESNVNGKIYPGERELEGFKDFLKKNSKAYQRYLENKSEL